MWYGKCFCNFYVNYSLYSCFVALLFHVSYSIQTGASYDNIGNIAPVYIILRTSCLIPQLILADFDGVDKLDAFSCYVFCVCVCVCVPRMSWYDSNQNLVQYKQESVKLFPCIL
jgi:hypothetical protein